MLSRFYQFCVILKQIPGNTDPEWVKPHVARIRVISDPNVLEGSDLFEYSGQDDSNDISVT